ncbi:unnamed protein product [Rotaria sordida]|uniref:Tetratricopeptide repeat protein n=1 Tax=Rotaria sordida TaxID=392033 RepID=A0A819I8Q6_9BILA|nr:unnamed protein product [Rotaria sordida]
MNGFLSTTIIDNVASFYHGDDQINKVNEGYKPVLFVFEIDTRIKQPYAYIGDCSTKPDEAEVLFSLGTIWRIKSIKLDKHLCTIELTPCDECDSQSAELLKQYTKNGCDLSSVGDILLELGNHDEAEWFYEKMLKQDALDNETRGILYYKIGMIRLDKKDRSVALENFKKAAPLLPSSFNESDERRTPRPLYIYDNQVPLIAIYNNMGFIHEENSEFKEAANCYKQALNVKNGSPSEIATVYNNLGLLYYRCGSYEKAREHHGKTIELIDESYPNWVEFKKNFDRADERWQHLMNKKQNDANV